MEGYTFVATDNLDQAIQTGHCICDHCGQRVETGIMNLADHWSKCWGKEEFNFIMSNPEKYIEMKKLNNL